jgi:hypothetical protein
VPLVRAWRTAVGRVDPSRAGDRGGGPVLPRRRPWKGERETKKSSRRRMADVQEGRTSRRSGWDEQAAGRFGLAPYCEAGSHSTAQESFNCAGVRAARMSVAVASHGRWYSSRGAHEASAHFSVRDLPGRRSLIVVRDVPGPGRLTPVDGPRPPAHAEHASHANPVSCSVDARRFVARTKASPMVEACYQIATEAAVPMNLWRRYEISPLNRNDF